MSDRRRAADTRQTVRILSVHRVTAERLELGLRGRGRLLRRRTRSTQYREQQRAPHSQGHIVSPTTRSSAICARRAASRMSIARMRARAAVRCASSSSRMPTSPSVYATSAICVELVGRRRRRRRRGRRPDAARALRASRLTCARMLCVDQGALSLHAIRSASHRAASRRPESNSGTVTLTPSSTSRSRARRPPSARFRPPTIVGAGSFARRAASASSRNRSDCGRNARSSPRVVSARALKRVERRNRRDRRRAMPVTRVRRAPSGHDRRNRGSRLSRRCGRLERNLPRVGELLLRAEAIEARALAFLLANAQQRDDAFDLADCRARRLQLLLLRQQSRDERLRVSAKLPQAGVAFGFGSLCRGRARSQRAPRESRRSEAAVRPGRNSVNPAPSRVYAASTDSDSTVRAACSRRTTSTLSTDRARLRAVAQNQLDQLRVGHLLRVRAPAAHSSAHASHAPTLLRVGIKRLAFYEWK